MPGRIRGLISTQAIMVNPIATSLPRLHPGAPYRPAVRIGEHLPAYDKVVPKLGVLAHHGLVFRPEWHTNSCFTLSAQYRAGQSD